MKKLLLSFLALCLAIHALAQCSASQAKIKVVLVTDQFPLETSWRLTDQYGIVLMQSQTNMSAYTMYTDSVCVDTGQCYRFKITDGYGDGICCNYGHGFFKIYYNGVLAGADSSYGSGTTIAFGCPVGNDCSTATTVATGNYTAPGPNSWYQFTPGTTGIYTISTCAQGNTCNTKIWVYDYCNNLNYDSSNLSTIYYADDNCTNNNESVNTYLSAGHTYYIRIGDAHSSCTGDSIHWSLSAPAQITGCMDTAACNFNPFATISDPGSCIYYPSTLCPRGPDLKVDSGALSGSIYFSTMSSTDVCAIREGCLNGYGTRDLVNFSTKIDNIGATDFYAGPPPADTAAYSSIFHWDACHGHWHFTNYAEYLLADAQNNFIPIGYKNGFCVLDLMCFTGSPKFGCNNMGITAGCADEYSSGLPCQWIDITDVADGDYKLIVRANWNPRPDYYGRYETDYFNNWAHTCIHIYHDQNNQRAVTVLPNCAPYIDCNGVENGLAVKDCDGNCNGTRLTGDINIDGNRDAVDVTNYLLGAIYHNVSASKCFDLNADSMITVTDAALISDCAQHGSGGTPPGHTHEPCLFPNKIRNPDQVINFSIANLDTVNKTLDILMRNPDCRVTGYQLKLKGLYVSSVQNLVAGCTAEMYRRSTGEVIALNEYGTLIPKSQSSVPVARIRYDYIDSAHVCIDSIVAVVNEALEEVINVTAVDSICLTARPTVGVSHVMKQAMQHTLSPNPFSDRTKLMVIDPDKRYYNVTVYDMLGRVVRSYPRSNDNAIGIERGDLAAGVYYLKAESAYWQFTEKLVIK